MTVRVNGDERQIEVGTTLRALVEQFRLKFLAPLARQGDGAVENRNTILLRQYLLLPELHRLVFERDARGVPDEAVLMVEKRVDELDRLRRVGRRHPDIARRSGR